MSPVNSMSLSGELKSGFDRAQRAGLIIGACGLALSILFSFHNAGARAQFFRSYLFAFVFWLSIPVGCQAILMLHHLTGGWWGYPIRRLLEAGTRTFPAMANCSCQCWWGCRRCTLGAARGGGGRPAAAIQAAISESWIFYGACSDLFRDLDWAGVCAEQMVREQDETGDPGLKRDSKRWPGRDLFFGGLRLRMDRSIG